MMPLCC